MTKKELQRLADNVYSAARENACETEGVTDVKTEGPQYYAAFVGSVHSFCDSLQSARECSDYGASKPLTKDQAMAVKKLILGDA